MSKSMQHEAKRARECRQLKVFQESFEEIADCEFEVIAKDPPDAFLNLNGRRVSIELTDIYWEIDQNGINKKEQESLAEKIVQLAGMKYKKLGLQPIYTSISFTDEYGLNKGQKSVKLVKDDIEQLSDYLVRIVVDNLRENHDLIHIEKYNDFGERVLDEKIESVWISKMDFLTDDCWTTAGGGMLPRITKQKLLSIIKPKEDKLLKYKNEFDENWLVIVEDWNGLSGYFDFGFINQEIEEKIYSDFDRIFILRGKRSLVVELGLSK